MDTLDIPLDNEDLFEPDMINSLFSLSNTELIQKTDKIISDIDELKNIQTELRTNSREQKNYNAKIEFILRKFDERLNGIEKYLHKQEENHQNIMKMFQHLFIQTNTRQPQRFRPLERTIDERTKFDYHPHVSKQNLQEHSTTLLLSESDSIHTEAMFDHIDLSQKKINRGKIQIGQWCDEINVFTTDDAPAQISTSISAPQEENSDPIHYQLSQQIQPIDTDIANPSIEVSFLQPFDNQISDQTDRDTTLKDYSGRVPVLIVKGAQLPADTIIEIASISSSKHGSFYGMYGFYDKNSGFKDLDSRLIGQSQRVELHNLKIRKKCNNNMKDGDTFTLHSYPSGNLTPTIIYSRKELFDKYNLDYIQLAVRFIRNNQILFDKIVYSNILSKRLKTKLFDSYTWKIVPKNLQDNRISFDWHNQYQIIYSIEIPEPFHCTIDSGSKWLKISLLTDNQPSIIYSVDCEYMNIKQKSFELTLTINKKTLIELIDTQRITILTEDNSVVNTISPENFYDLLENNRLNRFEIQFELFHNENFPHGPTETYENKCLPWKSEEFIEVIRQKRTHEQMNDDDDDLSSFLV